MISDEQLAELEAKAMAASPGTWTAQEEMTDIGGWEVIGPGCIFSKRSDAKFIAAANPATVLELIAEIYSSQSQSSEGPHHIEGHALWEQTVYRLERERDEWRDRALALGFEQPIPPEYDQVFRDNIDEILA